MVKINDDIKPTRKYQILWFDYVDEKTYKRYGEIKTLEDAIKKASEIYHNNFANDESFQMRSDILVVGPLNKRYSMKDGSVYNGNWEYLKNWIEKLQENDIKKLSESHGWIIAEQLRNILNGSSTSSQNNNAIKTIKNELLKENKLHIYKNYFK